MPLYAWPLRMAASRVAALLELVCSHSPHLRIALVVPLLSLLTLRPVLRSLLAMALAVGLLGCSSH